jgi:trans-2,3-dihydro-3-hydroxyanthranilate isomerase
MRYGFETVDVFTDQRFGGNPLAVFTDARGLSDDDMQALAAEFNLSETTFVLPAQDRANSVRVRIFNRTAEMPFAGHPSIGTAYVLARRGVGGGETLRLEVPAGVVAVELERDGAGEIVGGRFSAPQPLFTGVEAPAEVVAACVGLAPDDVITHIHRPILASVGLPFVLAQVTPQALARCAPDSRAFAQAADLIEANGEFPLHLYTRDGDALRVRMFDPLAGTLEDPATGSANATLGALLLALSGAETASFTVNQGVEMGRPSLLRVAAWRTANGVLASVAGRCVPVLSGEAWV